MKKILITGGCGFVGRHLTKRLSLDPNNQITIIDDLSTGLRLEHWPEHLKCKINDIRYQDCIEYFQTENKQFDVIFHLAAIVGGRLIIENNPLVVAKDLSIDAEMFNWSVQTKPGKIVYFSSSAIYPLSKQTKENGVPLSEYLIDIQNQKIDMPDMSYGWSKLTGEFLADLAVKKHGLNVVIYRPFSGYGEDQDMTYPFPSIINRVINHENPIDVWGDGTQNRDFIYIEDCIDGILLTYEKINDATPLNLGTGISTSFNELIERACKINSIECNINHLLDKPVGVHTRYANVQKSISYNIIPKTTLDDGIRIVSKYLYDIKKSI